MLRNSKLKLLLTERSLTAEMDGDTHEITCRQFLDL